MAFTVKRFKDYIYNELNREQRVRHMNDRALQFEDAEGRKIKISPDEGVQVEDSEGTIIHDTPNCLIASDMLYMGHLYFKPKTAGIASSTFSTGGGATSRMYYTTVMNVDLSTHLPTDLTNPTAVLIDCTLEVSMGKKQCIDGAYQRAYIGYCREYNSSVPNFSALMIQSAGNSTGTASLNIAHDCQAVMPIVWNGTSPYISWWHSAWWMDTTTITGLTNTFSRAYLYMTGFYA